MVGLDTFSRTGLAHGEGEACQGTGDPGLFLPPCLLRWKSPCSTRLCGTEVLRTIPLPQKAKLVFIDDV